MSPRPIATLLVANRGEIALRIIRTAQEMGIRTVAVASEADATAPHALAADECHVIGPGPAVNSYLDLDRILAAAAASGADALHPGYGFLSERVELSEACAAAGIRFVGPGPEAIRVLGDKIASKRLAQSAGVPIVPGFFEPGASDEAIEAAALGIGFPVMLKASAGGGGRGMRRVDAPDVLRRDLALAREEAIKAFGDGAMMVEKLIERPRHIEIQAIADSYGNVAILHERECSVQRRNQKLIEEAPSPFVDQAMAERLREAGEALLQAAGYVGAATVEFVADAKSREFYFLEVNARLQVEHPVTEAITGQDLVRLQLMVAAGERLPSLPTDRAAIQGWAIEARIIAEDPARGFLPSVGRVTALRWPRRPGIRVDAGIVEGGEVTPFYDSMIAKVIAHGPTREAARRRLLAALRDTLILGVRTNIAFLIDVLEDAEFVAGELHTGFLAERPELGMASVPPPELAAIAEALRSTGEVPGREAASFDPWQERDAFRSSRV